tara:strand:- start:369 stop:6113 length:5745 start_codon:yes stop_codon:yes gene_type:complete
MSVLYLAVRDFWYFERGPSGIPYSTFSSSINNEEARRRGQVINDFPYHLIDTLGKREQGVDQDPSPAICTSSVWAYPTLPTDADYLCHPELKNLTNPANVSFNAEEGSTDIGGGTSLGAQQNAWDAVKGCGHENRAPELANYNALDCPPGAGLQAQNFVCSGLYSNAHPWAADGFTIGPEGGQGGLWSPCLGLYAPGFSSWQMYQMRSNPSVRHLSDITTFGNGIRLFRTPGDAIFDQDPAPNLYASAYSAYYGNLYRVRLWTRADKYVDSQYRFPCNDSNGDTVSHYPPETNSRLRRTAETGGYTPEQKTCASGPTMLMYACSGIPVLTSDVYEILNKGLPGQDGSDPPFLDNTARSLNNYYYGDFSELAGPFTAEGNFECNVVPGIEQQLGETGRFVAKDWRPDQTNKYAELESGFRSKAAEILTTPDNLSPQDKAALEKYTTIVLPSKIKDRFKAQDTSTIPELLPVQKTGRELLTCFINRAKPKEHASEENGSETLTEMIDYQGSEFNGSNFDIDVYDPWHPANNGEKWPKFGAAREEQYPLILGLPDGVTDQFKFRYPIRVAYESVFESLDLDLTDELWDEMAPPWERELFELWYKKNPVYFHAIPGGWAWGGSGSQHKIRLTKRLITDPIEDANQCRWANQTYRLGQIDSIHQIAKFWNAGTCDAFPNYTFFSFALSRPMETRQLRNIPRQQICKVLNEKCLGFETRVSSINDCGGDGGACCPNTALVAASVHGCRDVGGPNCRCFANQPGREQLNCCNYYSPYSGQRKGFGDPFKPTATIRLREPTTIIDASSNDEKSAWNASNPSTQIGDSSLYGTRCSESGRCPIGFQCCCTSGCGGDCICIPDKLECFSPPCSKETNFSSDCCQKFGSCCYEDSDGKPRCIDNISEEECISRTKFGGLNGTFHQDKTCLSGPCSTTVRRGACFYDDKLLDHQICRETTSATCTGLSGEFYVDQECSEFTDKITTGYQKVHSDVNAKPQFAGDRSCGQYGFSVNCCTEETNEKTGVVTRTCEIKCMSDCDRENSRIVETCDSCGELGHCCVSTGYQDWKSNCIPRISEADCLARNGNWSAGRECDENSCVVYPSDIAGDRSSRFGSFAIKPSLRPDLKPAYRSEEEDDPFGADINPTIGDESGPGQPGAFGGCKTCDQAILGAQFALCLPGDRVNLTGHSRPTKPDVGVPWGCTIADNAAIRQCISRHVQVTKIGFRHLIFNSAQDFGPLGSHCPNASSTCNCCECAVNNSMCGVGPFGDVVCSGCTPGSFNTSVPIHTALSSLEVTVYPYKIRCQQVLTESGVWKCQELAEHIYPNQTTDFAVGIAGITDYKVCHNTVRQAGGAGLCSNNSGCPEYVEKSCTSTESANCVGQGLDTCETIRKGEPSYYFAPCCGTKYDVLFAGQNETHAGSMCPNLGSIARFVANSLPFPGESNVSQHIYSPAWGLSGIPASHCLRAGKKKRLDTNPPSFVIDSVFRNCAEYYNDKLLTDIDDGLYEEPEPYTELIFHDFGGLTAGGVENSAGACVNGDDPTRNWFKDVNAEFVDAQFGGNENPDEFWIKKQFPGLEYIRIFGAGCYNIPGSYEGGLGINLPDYDITNHPSGVSAGGNFAGTMVLVFGNTSEFQRYDEIYGSENLSLQFVTKVEGQPADFPLGTEQSRYKFVAQPSFNIRKTSDLSACNAGENAEGVRCAYSDIGYINGRGLTFANVQNYSVEMNPTIPPTATLINGGTGPEVGKVYEFCSYVAPNSFRLPQGDPLQTENDSAAKLKPVFVGGDPVPFFSGVRGPLVLYDRENQFSTVLKRFNLNSGIEIDGSYGECFDPDGNPVSGAVVEQDCIFDEFNERNDNQWFPHVDGITNGGAQGCCMHDEDDPLLTDGDLDDPLPDQPCMYWWQKNSDDEYHDNPDRTAGGGDCVCP